MFHDRAWMPHVAAVGGTEASVTMADGEWMGSSPIYTRRNLANAGVVGDTVSSIAKGIQLDIGGPDHVLDFRFEVHSDTEAVFWTEFCGPHDHLRANVLGPDFDDGRIDFHGCQWYTPGTTDASMDLYFKGP